MAKILVRADDLGYCEAVNYGIARAVKDGIVRSVGVMPNMDWAEHGVRLLDGTDVTFTVHSNICQGRPITDPKLIPSLVDENGFFKHKDLYRQAKEDFVVLEEVIMEVEAQFLRLQELTGVQIPANLASVRYKKDLHTDVISKEEMLLRVQRV